MSTPLPEERPVGSLELFERLANDPFGTVHRGLEWTAPRAVREVLVRQYHPAWHDVGLANRQHEIMRSLVHLGHLKPYKGCHLGQGGSLKLLWPYAPGRSLAQTLQAAEAQKIPFGIDQALFMVWGLSHHIRHLQQVQLSTGFLAPHRVWIGFDGWVQLLDMPVMGILKDLLPTVPVAAKTFEPYLKGPTGPGIDVDAFQLGALLYEMLTHQPLPITRDLPAVLGRARLSQADGEITPLPDALVQLLLRLLGCSTPFKDLQDLEHTMETSLFGGEFDPTTFGLAFAMQTIFRQEIAASSTKMMEEDPAPALPPPVAHAPAPRRTSWRVPLAAASVLVAGGLAWLGLRGAGTPAPTPAPTVAPTAAPAVAPVPLPVAPPVPPAPPIPAAAPVAPEQTPAPARPVATPKQLVPVRLRVFVNEQGRVGQVHVLSGAAEGSPREQAACALAMAKVFPAGSHARSWEEITVLVP